MSFENALFPENREQNSTTSNKVSYCQWGEYPCKEPALKDGRYCLEHQKTFKRRYLRN